MIRAVVVYVFPVAVSEHYLEKAVLFLTTYAEYHPGMEHETIIACNGGEPTEEMKFMFQAAIPNCKFMVRGNSGHDLGAYMQAAKENSSSDLMVFFGATTYLKGTGWLVRMVQSFVKHGPGLYGTMGNRGDSRVNVWPHIRTTGWWMPPSLFAQYPVEIKTENRYMIEHGPNCITSWIKKKRLPALVVSWGGEYPEPMWDNVPGGFHRDQQQGLLCGDRLSQPPYYHCS